MDLIEAVSLIVRHVHTVFTSKHVSTALNDITPYSNPTITVDDLDRSDDEAFYAFNLRHFVFVCEYSWVSPKFAYDRKGIVTDEMLKFVVDRFGNMSVLLMLIHSVRRMVAYHYNPHGLTNTTIMVVVLYLLGMDLQVAIKNVSEYIGVNVRCPDETRELVKLTIESRLKRNGTAGLSRDISNVMFVVLKELNIAIGDRPVSTEEVAEKLILIAGRLGYEHVPKETEL